MVFRTWSDDKLSWVTDCFRIWGFNSDNVRTFRWRAKFIHLKSSLAQIVTPKNFYKINFLNISRIWIKQTLKMMVFGMRNSLVKLVKVIGIWNEPNRPNKYLLQITFLSRVYKLQDEFLLQKSGSYGDLRFTYAVN